MMERMSLTIASKQPASANDETAGKPLAKAANHWAACAMRHLRERAIEGR
jgi:hypothetical protein